MPTIGHHLEAAAPRLASRGIQSPRLDAELLLASVLGLTRAGLLARRSESLPEEAASRYEALLVRREARVPVAYLVGVKEFWSLDFEVDASVLIPRPETEVLVEEALRLLPGPAATSGLLLAADVGTGAGPIAVALAHERPDLTVHATEISDQALGTARRNATRHGVAERIRFHLGDLLEPLLDAGLDGAFDLVASNPPYVGFSEDVDVEVRDWEPARAVFAGRSGGEIIERLIPQAARALRTGGNLLIEIAPAQETPARGHLVRGAGALFWTEVRTLHDLAGLPRVIAARRTGAGR
jgi:release factor glutamine methyltransferase